MEIKGKIVEILQAATGTSARGEWKRQDFIIETQEQYPKKVCVQNFNSKVNLEQMGVGTTVNASINIESREYNGKWYTSVNVWKMEAVGQLASEGFVELIPQLGAVVRSLSREEAIDLYETREALEAYAAAKAAERASDKQISNLEDNLKELKKLVSKVKKSGKPSAGKKVAAEFHRLDLTFHMMVIEASHNRRMTKVVGDSHILSRIFEADRHEFEIAVLTNTSRDHQRILDAIRKRDAGEASTAMQKHIQNSLQQILAGKDSETSDRWWQ